MKQSKPQPKQPEFQEERLTKRYSGKGKPFTEKIFVVVRGVEYPTQAEAARALGLSRQRISQIVSSGERKERKGNVTVVRGVTYPSQAAAARALGIAESSIAGSLNRGTIDNSGLGCNFHSKKRVIADGVRYESVAATGRALKIDYAKLRKRLRSGSTIINGMEIRYESSSMG